MNIFGTGSGFGMRASRRFGGHKRKTLRAEPETEEVGVEAVESLPGELVRRRQQPGMQEENQQWTKRGLFKVGFNIGSPRLRSARKFTK